MPVTPPATRASPSPPSPAPSSTSPRRVPESRLERALAQAERLQLYDHRAVTDVIARANGHRGKAALARAVRGEPKLTRSELEARFLSLVRQAGLPEPLGNFILDAPDHPRLEVHFLLPDAQPGGRDRRLGDPQDQGRVPERPSQGRRPHLRRPPRHALHL